VAGAPTATAWSTYSGTSTPLQKLAEEEGGKPDAEPFFAPPQGTFAAVTDENGPDTPILYQEVALEPYYTHQLSLTLYYRSSDPIAVPEPDTLAVEGEGGGMVVLAAVPGEDGFENQQLRVDVVKPSAPITSLNPTDILATVFANKVGDPEVMAPTQFSANLTPFAGQTVRLRIANAVNEGPFNAGVDAVSIASTPPSNVIKTGKLTLNKKKGSGSLEVTVPGAGVLSAADAAKKGKPKLIKAVTVSPKAAGKVKLKLTPNGTGLKTLEKSGKLSFKALLNFTPTGGLLAGQTVKGKLKLVSGK
jgi:hypothetical protein